MIIKTQRLFANYEHADGINLLNETLTNEFNISNYSLIYNKNGKPLLKEYNNIYFSISHSNNIVICAVNNKPIGIDIEEVRDYNKIINKILNINPKTNKEFFEEWTKREAYIKLKGLALKNINDNYEDCKFITKEYEKYIITIAEEI